MIEATWEVMHSVEMFENRSTQTTSGFVIVGSP